MIIAAVIVFIALVIAVFFTAVVLGLRQAHPADLTLQRPTRLAALARRVVGLHVRKGGEPAQTGPVGARDQVVR